VSQKRRKPRSFSLDFKVAAVKRLLDGENVTALSKELAVLRKDLYAWKKAYQIGGEKLLRPRGRPRKHDAALAQQAIQNASELEKARHRVLELERKVGQQELELDFFAKALRCIEQTGVQKTAQASANLSKRKHRKAH